MNIKNMLNLCSSWGPKKDVEKATLHLYLLKEICEYSLEANNRLPINLIQIKDYVLIAIGESVHYRRFSTVLDCVEQIKEFVKLNNFILEEDTDCYTISW
jgi:hypothetical protein